MGDQVQVMLVEDHTLVREGIKSLLAGAEMLTVAVEAGSGREALAAVAQSPPDVILMDLSLPDVDGIEVTRQIHEQWPAVRVVVLTMYTDSQYVHDAFQAGAVGYLTKSVSRQELVDAVTLVMQGQTVLPRSAAHLICHAERAGFGGVPVLASGLSARALEAGLTERECEVLAMLAQGLGTEEVGRRLFISPKTVKTHLQRIYAKLNVSDRLQAVVQAGRLGLLPGSAGFGSGPVTAPAPDTAGGSTGTPAAVGRPRPDARSGVLQWR